VTYPSPFYYGVREEDMGKIKEKIVQVCWSLYDRDGNYDPSWSYELVPTSGSLKELKKKYHDVKIAGAVVDRKEFVRGDLTRTCYIVLKCDDGNTYIEKFRVESGGSWSLIVKSDVSFNDINSFNAAEEAWRNAFLREYPANCAFLIP
jgi:hypothetical protein